MRYYARMTFGAVIISAVCALSTGRGATLPEAAKIVPAETMFLIEVGSFGQLEEQFKKTNFYKLYKDPAMAAFVEHFEQNWRQKLQESDNEFIKSLLDVEVRPTGRVVAALMMADYVNEGEDFGAIFAGQWGPGIDKVKETIDKMVQKALEQGAQRTAEDYRSVRIISIIKPREPIKVAGASGGEAGDDKAAVETIERAPLTVSYCFIEDILIGGIDVKIDAVKFLVAHIQGASGNTLAKDGDYVSTMKSLAEGRDIEFYLNIKQLINRSLSKDSTGRAATMLTNLGFNNVRGLAFSIGFVRKPGVFLNGSGFVKVAGEKKGVLKIVEPVPAPIKPPRFVGASAYSVSFLFFNIKDAYDELFKMLSAINPMLAAPLTVPLVPAGPDGEPGLELKRDIIDYFGSEIIIAESINKAAESGTTPTSAIVSIAVTDRKVLEKSLSTLHSKLLAASEPEARRELLGHTIYTIAAPPFFQPGTGRTPMPQGNPSGDSESCRVTQQVPTGINVPMPKIAFTVTDTHLVIGSESSVEQAVRTLSESGAATVAEASWFRTAKSEIPAVVGLAALSDDATYIKHMWQQLKDIADKSEGSNRLVAGPFAMVSEGLSELIDFNLLPEFEAVSKHFGLSASYAISRADGFYFEFKELSSPNN